MQPLADHGQESYVGHGRLKDKVALITGGDSGIGRAVAHRVRARRRRHPRLVLEGGRGRRRDAGPRRGRRTALPDGCGRHRRSRPLPRARGPGGRRARTPRRARQQRGLPDELRVVPGDPARRARVRLPHEHPRDVPPLPGRGAARWGPVRRSSTRRRSRRRSPARSCCTTRRPRARSAPSPRGSPRKSPSAGSGSTPSLPVPIWTPLVAMSFPAEKNAQFGADTPLGRPGQPGELAPLYVFLATSDPATSAARSSAPREASHCTRGGAASRGRVRLACRAVAGRCRRAPRARCGSCRSACRGSWRRRRSSGHRGRRRARRRRVRWCV